LLIVMGSSLKVHPVASVPDYLPPAVPQILINLEPILDHNFDLFLPGDCQTITERILNQFSK
jgi:NAD+-dependent protein deacetylase SIR2